VCEFLVAGYFGSGRSYDVIYLRASSLGRGCGESPPSVVEQPLVIETCNFGEISTGCIVGHVGPIWSCSGLQENILGFAAHMFMCCKDRLGSSGIEILNHSSFSTDQCNLIRSTEYSMRRVDLLDDPRVHDRDNNWTMSTGCSSKD